ncbi:MAG: RNA polymerase sigma factor [Acidobacteriota bacterium]
MASEQELLQRALRFEPQALAAVYDLYSPGLYGYALRLLGQPDAAEDCVAETFNRFLQALREGKGPRQSLKAYLYRMAHNWVTDRYRRMPPVVPLESELWADEKPTPPEVLDRNTEAEYLRQALAQLTPEQRQVIVLKYVEDWTNEEIALALDKPVGAVKSLQHRALAALQRILIKEDDR